MLTKNCPYCKVELTGEESQPGVCDRCNENLKEYYKESTSGRYTGD